jgi:transposase-like protein
LKSKIEEKDIELIDNANKMFKCNNKEEAISKFNELKNKWKRRYLNVIYSTEIKLGQSLRFYDYPSRIRNSLKSQILYRGLKSK